MGPLAKTGIICLATAAFVSLATPQVRAQTPGASLLPSATKATERAPGQLALEDFPGAMVDKVVVPVPGEIFAVMDKLGAPNWSGELREAGDELPVDRVILSLAFGATVAEGFLAVQAEKADSVRDLGRRLLKLASALGIEDRVVPHYRSIIEATDLADWRLVRAEIDKTQQAVRQAMEELRDGELATLVSLGGWLRGTEALTSLIVEAYNTDRAELLHQPGLVIHFVESVTDMSEGVRTHTDVAAITGGLVAIHEAMTEDPAGDAGEEADAAGAAASRPEIGGAPDGGPELLLAQVREESVVEKAKADPPAASSAEPGVISVEQVKRINAICAELLQRFYSSGEGTSGEDEG